MTKDLLIALTANLLLTTVTLAQIEMGFSIWVQVTENSCSERITFLGEKEYLAESGEQMVTKAYKFSQYRKTDFYIFHQRTVANNEALGCSGTKAAKVGTRLKVYVKFNNALTEMHLYAEPDDSTPLNVIFEKYQQTYE